MAVVEPGYLVAHTLDLVNGVADQNDRRAAGQQLGHALFTLLLKQEVTDGQNLVGNQDVASDKATLETAAKTFDELTGVLGLLYNRKKTDSIPAEVTALVEERAAAKKAKDWGRADAIRAQLTEMGWSVTDTAQGPKLAKL